MIDQSDSAIDGFYADIGRRIRDARIRMGSTQAQIAARASMTRSSLANIEAGRQRIPIHILVSVAEVLGVDVVELFPTRIANDNQAGLDAFFMQLDEEPEITSRDFIQGAIAQLGSQTPKEGNG